MTCRHGPDDWECSSHPYNIEKRAIERADRAAEKKFKPPVYASMAEHFMTPDPTTPDKYKYNIVDVERDGPHLVLKVEYPNCKKCSYEGKKVMVFLNVPEKDALKWREIDPHFRAEKVNPVAAAPTPAARFPANAEGWGDALAYARGKVRI